MPYANFMPMSYYFVIWSMKQLDGHTTGPSGFSGPIGSALHASPDLLLCKFDAIPSKLPALLTKISDFSTDQQYLNEIYQSIISGSCTITVLRNLLDVIQGRWLIPVGSQQQTAFYALYVPSTNPSPTLKICWQHSLCRYFVIHSW